MLSAATAGLILTLLQSSMVRPGGKDVRANMVECWGLVLATFAVIVSWATFLGGLFFGARQIRHSVSLQVWLMTIGIATSLFWAVLLAFVLLSNRNGNGRG